MSAAKGPIDFRGHIELALASVANSARWLRRSLGDATRAPERPSVDSRAAEYDHAARVEEDLT